MRASAGKQQKKLSERFDKRTWMLRYNKTYYQAHLEYHRRYRQRQLAETKRFIIAHKSRPCFDCGCEYPWYVMEFDHVRGRKQHKINQGLGWVALQKEIAKCDVVCANCHAVRTYKRRGRKGGWNTKWRGPKKLGASRARDIMEALK